jgi:uncharacterized protein
MSKQVLFIQGAGEGAHEEDAKLAESLRSTLGTDYEVIYPALPNGDDAPYDDWKAYIEKELAEMHEPVILAGHSVGASTLLKYLSEVKPKKPIAGVFLMATPFWGGDGWLYEGYEELELPDGFAAKLPKNVPVFLYHCRDDDTVPYEHLALFEKLLPHAVTRQLGTGGHQFNNDLAPIAEDIKSLKPV